MPDEFDPATDCTAGGCSHDIGCAAYQTCIPDKHTGEIKVWPSCAMVNLIDPDPKTIYLVDIANALARQCRYNGHVEGFISVAEHCIEVSEILAEQGHPFSLQRQGLMHDAAEAYVGDMVAPLKHLPGMYFFRAADDLMERTIAERFGLDYPWHPAVKQADQLSGQGERGPNGRRTRKRPSVHPEKIAEHFLDRADRLGIQ